MSEGTEVTELHPPVALTIAGSDSGGGAGIQADLRTFAFQRVHGTAALTCVTAQNTLGVNRVDALPPAAVAAQIEAVVGDIGVQGIKTGMLLNAEIVLEVARQVERLSLQPLVVDPVMVSRTGARLLAEEAIVAIRERLLPLAQVVTPNRYEAQILSGLELSSLEEMKAAAERIRAWVGSAAVLVKGGGMSGDLQGVDVWFDGERLEVLKTERILTRHTHGTGCTLSAAIAAQLAWGKDPFQAVQQAKFYVTEALRHPLAIGGGQGPVGHFYPLLG
ncbi:MAG: bifunctional hydroxymethylpyrimidine kinase/phosphomethylpyrimidine kinase [Thermostichus sp. DG02_2_bins_29]